MTTLPLENFSIDHFFHLALDLMCIASIEGYFLKLNLAWEEVLGYALHELEGQSFFKFIHPDDIAATNAALSQLTSQQPIISFTNRYQHRDGSYRSLEWRSNPHGRLIYAVARDVTQRIITENALRESEARYSSVVTTMREGVVLQTSDGAIQTCNAAAEHILGLTVDQMMGRTSLDPRWHTIHEDGSPFPGETHPAMVALRTGQPVNSVMMGVHKPDGQLSWISINSQPIFRANETSPYATVTTFVDVTERQQTQAQLRATELRQRAVLKAIPDLMFRNQRDGTYVDYHAPATEDLLVPPEAFIGRKIQDILPPEAAATHLRYIEQVLDTGQSVGYEYMLTVHEQPQHFEARMVVSGRDEVLTIVRNISDRRRLEEQTLALKIERERGALLQKFVQNMSHEIRTPLTIVNTYLYLLARLNEREKREWYMLQATERIMQLNQLLDKVLQMTKLDFGLVLHNQSVQLVTLLQGAIQSIEGEYQDAHAELRWHADTPLPRVNGDPIWLQEAFMELLKNAIKFTPSTGSITIQAFAEGEQVLIEIHDNGIGMNHEELTHIFERFWRQDEAHSTPGFGLGLPIAQQIIHLHHGTIHITSIPEQGTTVQVRLPRQS